MDAFNPDSNCKLFDLSSLMSCTGEKLSMLVLSHLLPSLFDNATQSLTSSPYEFLTHLLRVSNRISLKALILSIWIAAGFVKDIHLEPFRRFVHRFFDILNKSTISCLVTT